MDVDFTRPTGLHVSDVPDLGPRYIAVQRLGRGGQGGVWLATDTVIPRQVAIKLIPADGQGRVLLRREYAMLGRLLHPGLPRVHELMRTGQTLALVFELIEGQPLDSWWAGRPLPEVVQALAQLLGILDFLHRRGVLHRDVKPDNVLVAGTGVRLVDLGLAVELGDDGPTSGTAGYIAPEVLAGGRPSIASDLYAVGVLLFHAVWGRPPFEGAADQIVAQQLQRDVELPREGGSEGLRAVVRQLLVREPARRPSSAAETLGLLEELEPRSVLSADRLLVGLGLPAPVLVHREPVIEAVVRAMDTVSSGATSFALTGPPGSGRTRMCDEIVCLAGLRGMQVERGVRFRGGEQGTLDPAAIGARVVQTAVNHLCGLAADGPLLLVLDGLDDPLQGRVVQAAHRIATDENLPLMVCVAVEQMPRELELLQSLPLTPLDETGVAQLVASMLPSRWSSGELAAWVHRRSGGSPLLAVELTRLVVARQLERRRPGVDLTSALDDLEHQVSGAALWSSRLAGLEPGARLVAALIALFDDGLLRASLDADECSSLAQLVQHGLVTEGQDARLQLSATLLMDPLLRELGPAARLQLGRRALRILEGAPADERAMLMLRCGLIAEEPGLMLQGARAAGRALDLPRAMRLYRAALEQAPDPVAAQELAGLLLAAGRVDEAVDLLREIHDRRDPDVARALADAQLRAGDPEAGLATLQDLEAEPSTRLLQAKLLLFAGRHVQALELATAQPEEPEALHVAGLARYYLGQLAPAQQALEQARELALQGGDLLLQARVTNSLALVHQGRGELGLARDCYARCVTLARQLSHLPFEATFEMNLGSVAQQQGEHAVALASYTHSLEVARRFGGGRETAQVMHNLGRLLGQMGQLERGRAQIHRSLGLSRQLSWRSLQAHNLVVQAEIELARAPDDVAGGQSSQPTETTQDDLIEAARIFDELGEQAGWAEAQLAQARLWLGRDRSRAVELVLQVQHRAEGMPAQQIQAELILGQTEATAALAVAHLQVALQLAQDTGQGEHLVEIHHRLALALEAQGETRKAAEQRQAASRLLQQQLNALEVGSRAPFVEVGVRREVLAGGSDAQAARGAGEPRSGAERSAQAVTTRVAPTGHGTASAGDVDAHLLAALLAINKELAGESDLTRLLERIIDHAVDLSGAERGFLLLMGQGEAGAPLQIEVARNIDQETIRRREFKISRSVAEEVLGTGQPLITINAMDDTRFQDFLSVHNLRLRSILCVPMTIRRVVRGAIYVDNRFQNRAFTPTHVSLLSALADQAALAIGNRERLAQLQRQGEELQQSQRELQHVNQQLEAAMERQRRELAELSHLARSQRGELEGRYRFDNLVGQSAAMRELFRLMDRVTDSDVPVYIHGESGTGKELVAKALHYNSGRREGPFIGVNCGAIPATLLESELFGYEKGAFTGAERRHRGLLQRSHGGSLFLDEVGDMPAELQVKLLRVLQEKTFQSVGGEHEQEADFRLLAASNKDLAELVQQGSFREDLYYRINVIQLRLPALRERCEDIPLLVEHLMVRHGAQDRQLSRAALHALMDHRWPGNVRELENELMRALALGGPLIQPEDLSFCARRGEPAPGPHSTSLTLKEATAEVEQRIALEALQRSGGSVTEAARLMGMTRVGLHKLMARHGIRREGVS